MELAALGLWLDSMFLRAFSNLNDSMFYDSMIFWLLLDFKFLIPPWAHLSQDFCK